MASPESISKIVNRIKNLLEGEFLSLSLIGEVSNFSNSGAGHIYFTLSDQGASLSAALFRGDALRNPLVRQIKDGDQVIVTGSLGVYQKRGSFQIIVKRIQKAGAGDLKREFEILKRKLSSNGLFDLDVKKIIPSMAKRVAVITSLNSAAMSDFKKVYERRSHWMDLLIVPAMMQGEGSAASIIKALKKIEAYQVLAKADRKIDVVVLTRGGGAIEDLWSFNSEDLARKIFDFKIPIISAIGHEVDFTISDFVADKRCETPTAAAEVLTQGQSVGFLKLEKCKKSLKAISPGMLHKYQKVIGTLSPFQVLSRIKDKHRDKQKTLDSLNPLMRPMELLGVHEKQMQLDECRSRLLIHPMKKIEESLLKNEGNLEKLGILNPRKILGRGYSYISLEKGTVVKNLENFKKIKRNEILTIHFQKGSGKVTKI